MRTCCLLILVFCTTQVLAHLLPPGSCSRYCKDEKNMLDYEKGFIYLYKYSGSVQSLLYRNSSKDNDHNLNFTANLKIDVLSACDFELTITSVEVEEGIDENFRRSLTKHPVKFSYQNGKILTVCPVNEETTPVLNIKRGILSSFQTNLEENVVFETDVSGTCETKYEISHKSDNLDRNVMKTKDLTSCNKRSTKQFSWHSEVYNRKKAKFSSPLLRSTQNCTQEIRENILSSVNCVEKHLFRPFSNGENGAATILKQQLRFLTKQDTSAVKEQYEVRHTSLTFEKAPPKKVQNTFQDINIFRELMRKVEVTTTNGIEKDVPELFSRLVNIMGNSEQNFLLELFQEIKHSKLKRKFFVDVLSASETIESIRVMKKLHEEEEISHELFNSWITSLSFIKNPSKEHIYSLSDLLDVGNPTKQKVYLTISGLIHQYCKNTYCDEEFTEILEKIAESIQNKCASTSLNHHEDIILSLKAIGNTGHPHFAKYLKKCYLNSDVLVDIKVAAIQAHKRMSCDQNQNVRDFEDMFSSFNENSEVRINSYLAMMQCSSYSTLEKIKYVLNEEETNQVGSFVWSHLVNLQRTETFWKQDLKKLIENDNLKTKFNTDPRKYSRNYELSTFFSRIDTGIALESNVIFTQDSYLPKSAMFNFTVDVFGETVNLLEIGARMEGFEDIVENIFGHNGYFPEKSIKAFLENRRNEHEISLLRKENKNTLKKSPVGLLYVKIFGHEVYFTKFDDFKDVLGKSTDIYSFLHASIGLLKDIEYSRSLKFLDANYEVPTILGFPLELSVNGTAILGLITRGNINIKELKDYRFDVEGKVSPSASVQVIGNMNVDTYFNTIGLRTVSTLNSNTFLDGLIKIDHGKLIDIRINTPKSDIDVISIASDVYLTKGHRLFPPEDISEQVTNRSDCTGSYFERVTGLQICHHLRHVNASSFVDAPYFPLTGSFKYGITARKMDTFDSYIFKWTYQKNSERGNYGFSLTLDTPNSSTNRKLNASFLLDTFERILELKMSSQIVSFEFLGKIDLDPKQFSFTLRHSYNHEEILNLQAVLIYFVPKYDLNIALNYKNRQMFLLHGHLTQTPSEVTSKFQVKIKKKNYIFDSALKIKDGSYNLSSIIQDSHTNITKGSLTIQLLHNIHSLSLVSKVKYNINSQEETLSLILKTWREGNLDYRKYGFYLKFVSSQKPKYNILIDFETHKADFHYDLKGVVSIFGKTWQTRQLLKFLKNNDEIDAAIINSLACPEKNLDYIFTVTYNTSNMHVLAKLLIQLNAAQRLEVIYNLRRKTDIDKNLEILLYIPKNSYSIKGEIRNIKSEEYSIKLIGERETSTKEVFLDISGVCLNSTKDNFQDYSLSGMLDLKNSLLKSPWNFKANFQVARDLLAANIDIQASTQMILAQLSWMQNSFATNFQIDDKKIFFTNIKWNHEVDFAIGLNVYQNFELDVIFQPKTRMSIVFYWDKHNDLTRKVYLNLQNLSGGIYAMELEYPNQKVTTSFTLQSTQITLNITWGLETYQKIYLNVGSRVYDLGGIWYGELETPFKYFEVQQFNIKYLIMQNNVNVQVKVFWREQRIDFELSGSRSPTHVNGKLEMRTTLSELYKFGLAVSHIERSTFETLEKVTNISMVYNQHQVNGYNQWTKTGMNVDVKFELVSPSKTLKPIFGNFEIRNNESNSHMNSLISWQEKEISVNYKVDSTKSMIMIKTPFEGIERTKFQYSLIRTIDDLLIMVEIDILNELNYAFLRWSNENNNTYNVEFQITSRFTGRYQLFFKHSTHQGYLMENLVVNHGENNNTILGIQINGNVVSVWDVDLHWSVKFLDHNATLSIQNSVKPFVSNIEVRWDNLTISNNLELVFIPYKLDKAFWLVKSSLLEEDLEIVYTARDRYHLAIKIPRNFALENNLEVLNNNLINQFSFKTPKYEGKFNFKHSHQHDLSYHDHVKFEFENIEVVGNLKYKLGEFAIFDRVNMEVRSSLHDAINFDYALNKNFSDDYISLRPEVLVIYNNYTVQAKSNFQMWNFSSFSIHLCVNGTEVPSFNFSGRGSGSERNLDFEIKSNVIEGQVSLNPNKDLFLVNLKSKLTNMLFKIQMDDEHPLEMYFKSNIQNWENLHLKFDGDNRVITLKKNNETTTLNYRLGELSYDDFTLKLEINVTSDVDYLNNSLLFIDTNHTQLQLRAKLYVYNTEFGYLFNFKDVTTPGGFENRLKLLLRFGVNGVNITDIYFDAKTKFIVRKDETGISFNLIGNKSKLDVELSKKNWQELSLKILSILDGGIFTETDINYKLFQKRFEAFCDTKSTFGLFNAQIEMSEESRKLKKIITRIEYSKDDVRYLGTITTKYDNILRSDSEVEFKFPNETYRGNLKIQLGITANTVIASVSSQQSSNKVEFFLNMHNIKRADGIFDFHLDLLETSSNRFTFDYNLESADKKLAITYHPGVQTEECVKLQVTLNRNDVNIDFDLPHQKRYFYLNGRNVFRDNEVSLVYEIKYSGTVLKTDVFYTNKSYTQTKLEIASNIKGYERIIFENRIDDNKVRIFIHTKFHRFSLIADKTALGEDKDLFSIYYNSEPLIVMRKGNDQSYLMTSTKYTNYKLTITYVHDPAIYTFSILKNGENLMSFMLLNTSSSKSMGLKGKLVAPVLFQDYPEVVFNINANYDISKFLQFTISSENKNLFEVKWSSKLGNGLYEAYLKYFSEIPVVKLKKFEVHPSLNMWNDFSVKIDYLGNGENLGYFAELTIPMKTLDTKFIIEYPCTNQQCKYNFYINRTYVDVNWLLPIENMNDVKFVVNLNSSSGDVIFQTDGDKLEGGWIFNTQLIRIYLNSHINKVRNYQEIYYNNDHLDKTLKIEVDGFKSLFNFKPGVNKSVKASFIDQVTKTNIDFDGFISDTLINLTLNNSAIVTNLTITKEENIDIRILSDFVADHKILSNGDERTLFNKLITMTQFLTVPFVGKDIRVKTVLGQENFEAYLTITAGNMTDTYTLMKTEKNLLILAPNFEISATYENTDVRLLTQFLLEGFNKTIHLKLDRKIDYVDSQIVIDNNDTLKINLHFEYAKINNIHSVKANLPVSLSEFLESNLSLSFTENSYSLDQTIIFPDSNNISVISKATFLDNQNYFELHVLSTWTDDYHGMITYDVNEEDIKLVFLSSLGHKNSTFTCKIIPKKELSAILHTPFAGFNYASIEAKFDEANQKASLQVLRETHALSLEGTIGPKSESLYEINMVSKNLEDDSTMKIQIKLDRKIMKFNADLSWDKAKFLFDLNYDPKNYELNLETPLEKLKNLNLSGVYLKKDNSYNLEGNGNWGTTTIIFVGNLNLEPDNFGLKSNVKVGNLEGDVEMIATTSETEKHFLLSTYYPKPSSNAFLALKCEFDDESNLKGDLTLKTTFQNLKNISISLIKNESKVYVKTLCNIMEKEVLVDVTSNVINDTIRVNSNIILPNETVSSELYLDILRTSYFKMGSFFVQYDIDNKYLFKILFAGDILEIAHQNLKGELFAQIRGAQFETSYVLWKELKCNLKNNLLSVNLHVSEDQFNFLQKHFTGHYSEIIYLNNLDVFQLYYTDSGYELIYNLEAHKILKKLIFRFDKLFYFHYDHAEEDRLLILEVKDYLNAKFNSSKMFIEFIGNFVALDNVKIFGKLQRQKLFAETVFKFERNHRNLIRFKEFHDSTKMGIVFEFDDLHAKLNHEYQHSKMTVHIRKDPHELTYEFSDLGTLKFSIRSPALENRGFTLSVNVNLPLNLTFRISSIDNNVSVSFESFAKPNSFRLDFRMPQNRILSYVQFETVWGDDLFKTLNNVQIESSNLGNVSIVGNFDLKTDGLDIVTHLNIPFLEGFEKLNGEVHIHKNLTPWFYVTLPNNKTYSIKAVYVNNENTFKVDSGLAFADRTYGFKVDYSKDGTLIVGEITTPFEGYKRYGFRFEKDDNVRFLTLNVNERVYNVNVKSNLSSKSQLLTVNLETPFKGYEKYYIEVQHEDKIFNCFVFYPELKRPFGFGFNTKIQFGVSFKISLPFPVHDFEHTAFEIKIIPAENDLYNISASSELNDKHLKLNLVVNNKSHIYSILETNNNKIVYKMIDLYENHLIYNKDYIYNIDLRDSPRVYIDLYYRKFIFIYDANIKNFQIKLWDPKNRQNKYGCHFLKSPNGEVVKTSIGLYLPSKISVIEQQYFKNVSNFVYAIQAFFNEEKVIGFDGEFSKSKSQDLIEFYFKTNLFTPNRVFEHVQQLKLHINEFEPLSGVVKANLRWDKDEKSQLSYRGVLNERHLESVFAAGFIDHDVIFKIDFTKLNETPFGFTLEIKYSNDERKTIRLEMFYNKSYVNGVAVDERRFLLKQPYSKLDHTLISKTVTSEKYTNITALLKYTDFALGKPDFMKMSLEIGRKEFEVSGIIESKRNSILVYSKSITDIYSKGLQLKMKINDKEPLNLNYLYVYEDYPPSFKATAGYGDDRYYHFYVGLPNKKEITAHLIHNIYGKETTDGLLILKLNTTSLLWTKILWKTQIFHQFHHTVIEEYEDLKYVVQTICQQLVDVIHDETGGILLEEYRNTKGNITEGIMEEAAKVAKEWENLRRFCDNNMLYCQDILHLTTLWSNSIFQNATTPIFDVIKEFWNNTHSIANQALEVFAFTLKEMERILGEIKNFNVLKGVTRDMLAKSFEDAKVNLKNMRNTAVKLLEGVQNYLLSAKASAEMIFKPVFNLLGEFWVYFEYQKTYVQLIALDTIGNVRSYVSHLQEVKQMVLIYNKITTWISSLDPVILFAPIWNILEITLDNIVANVNHICEEYFPFLGNLKSLITKVYKQSLPKIKDIRNILETVYEKSVWFWKYHNITENIKNYVTTKTITYFKMLLKNVFGSTREGLGIFDYIYKPDVGAIELSQRLPVEWESFEKSPKFEQHPLYNHIFEKISSFTMDRFERILAKIEMFIYTILNITIKPPSNNMAMVIANSHFITFNNKHFDFHGNCSYLLINNLDANSFSVVLEAGDSGRLTIITHNDSATISVFKDAPIIFNSRPVEFPLIQDTFYMYREDDSIMFGNQQGLSITCNLHYNYCTFKVSEWLFGKIGGMLGTMDNEPSTDMRKPNGSNIVDVDDFVKSWRAGQCTREESRSYMTENVKIPTFVNRAMNTICSETFLTTNSSLSSCFSILDPQPYYDLCLKDIKTNSKSVCSSIAAYKQMCNHKHIVIKVPDFCVNCNLNDENADIEDGRIFDGHNPKTMDVVFLQENGCLPNVDSLKHPLYEALNQKGFTENRFSFIIYGGDILVKPFIRTVNGSIWTNDTISSNNPTKTSWSTLPRIESQVEEAIRYAAKLEFRPAVTKMFILVQCEACSEMARSPEMYSLLGEKDITLHIIKPDPFKSRGLLAMDSTKNRIDSKGILKETTSNEKVMDSLDDICCGLALSTAGTVSKGILVAQDTYKQRWAELVAGTARRCSCQKCRCIQKANAVGKTDCNRCMSPMVKQLLNEYESQHVRL